MLYFKQVPTCLIFIQHFLHEMMAEQPPSNGWHGEDAVAVMYLHVESISVEQILVKVGVG